MLFIMIQKEYLRIFDIHDENKENPKDCIPSLLSSKELTSLLG